MSKEINDGSAPAHPFTHKPEYQYQEAGLTKREAFAMAAMQGLLGCSVYPTSMHGVDVCEYELCAISSVKQADALLKELAK